MNSSEHSQTDGQEEEAADYIDQDEFDFAPGREGRRLILVAVAQDGARLDRLLAESFPELSRTYLQKWVAEGQVLLDHRPATKPSQIVRTGQAIEVIPSVAEPAEAWLAEPLLAEIVFEDADLIVVNKPAGLVVHPGAGHPNGTLANGLIGHAPEMAQVPRAGIVHRLDRDTTGLLVAAKTLPSQVSLVRQLEARKVRRTYWALVWGCPRLARVSTGFGRDQRDRKKMAVLPEGQGKEAITRIESAELGLLFGQPASLLRLQLETGRTHQIRVHLEYLGHPLVGDITYKRRAPHANRLLGGKDIIQNLIPGQALHAQNLEFIHPVSEKLMRFSCPPPSGLARVLELAGLGEGIR
jgi:23S rRNA pseudouridine1911/1915/1917 synthase